MFRREDLTEPMPGPHHKTKTSWGLILCVLAAGIVLAHMAGMTRPLHTMALEFLSDDSRDMSRPSGRLVGQWDSEDDPVFTRVCFERTKQPSGAGVYTGFNKDGSVPVGFRIISEDRAGTRVRLWELVQGQTCYDGVDYDVGWDGLSMTKEYVYNGKRVHSTYRYTTVVAPPEETGTESRQ